ncbi:hypothetical protein SEA_TORTELLINI_64 [Mycobacterium phage Tortellini]|uniref:Uncharacterized protein n=1 Tax=Mycobacterium phage Tortellini TaxID=1897497 RepID=A0A1D8EX37_9CAUD|nr:hypothetical protein FDH05_gp64 [Mycobacterium phage Tortellini]AOT25809.1 hypothetical protein SEA_TORTELLINI_64 [Mycobacterium phage Tortellini]
MSDVVERAKAALEGTTEGPWGTNGSMIATGLVKVARGVTEFKQSIAKMDDDAYLDEYEDDEFDGEYPPFEQKIADAEFVAQARTLVPELVAEVERLRAEKLGLEISESNLLVELRNEVERLREVRRIITTSADRGAMPAFLTLGKIREALAVSDE